MSRSLCTGRHLPTGTCHLCCVGPTAMRYRQAAAGRRVPLMLCGSQSSAAQAGNVNTSIARQSRSAGIEPRSRLALLLSPFCHSCGAVPALQGPAVDPPACPPGHPAAAGGPAAPVTWQGPPYAAARRHTAAVSVPAVRMVQTDRNGLRLHWAAAGGRSTGCLSPMPYALLCGCGRTPLRPQHTPVRTTRRTHQIIRPTILAGCMQVPAGKDVQCSCTAGRG